MKKILSVLVACVLWTDFCHAGPFGLGMEDQISNFPKIEFGSFNGEPCYIIERPIILKEVNGKFMLFFENDRLAKMIAVSESASNKEEAEKYFKSIYDYISGFGGTGELEDGHKYTVSQVSEKGRFDVTWHDYEPDPFSSEENEICRMNLKMTQNKEGQYVVLAEIIYRNARDCRLNDFNNDRGSLEERAEAGDAAAQAELGKKYYDRKQYHEARKWFEKAAAGGNPIAQNGLGLMYTYKQGGLPAYHDEAIKFYEKAADQGLAEARYNLGYLIEHTSDRKIRNFKKAYEYYQQAADEGYPQAMYAIGEMYRRGRGVEMNSFKAVEWYEEASAKNCADAQYELGFAYYNGVGAEKNMAKGQENFGLACDNGHEKACEKYAWINKYHYNNISR